MSLFVFFIHMIMLFLIECLQQTIQLHQYVLSNIQLNQYYTNKNIKKSKCVIKCHTNRIPSNGCTRLKKNLQKIVLIIEPGHTVIVITCHFKYVTFIFLCVAYLNLFYVTKLLIILTIIIKIFIRINFLRSDYMPMTNSIITTACACL